MMIFNTKKILFLAMAVFVCVAARPEVAASEDDTLRIAKATPTPIEETKAKLSPFFPKPLFPCPFDCTKVCVVKVPFTCTNPPAKFAYICHREVHKCCKDACSYYQKCVYSGEPEWACYADTLDYLCKCRSQVKETKE